METETTPRDDEGMEEEVPSLPPDGSDEATGDQGTQPEDGTTGESPEELGE